MASTREVGQKVQVRRYAEAAGTVFRAGCERRLVHTEGLMMVVIDFRGGPWEAPDPFHDHPHEQTTYVAAGDVLFLYEDGATVQLTAGDLVAIPAGVPHAIQLLSPHARLVDSFQPLREDFLA